MTFGRTLRFTTAVTLAAALTVGMGPVAHARTPAQVGAGIPARLGTSAPARLGTGIPARIGAGTPAQVGTGTPQTTTVDMVIAVDESGSLSDDDVKRERDASAQLAASGLNNSSRVTVFGFGSATDTTTAIDPVCPTTVLSSDAQRASLAACVGKLHRRTQAEGYDTDHAAALSQALGTFDNGSPNGALKLIFILTDGVLDVSNSTNWGRTPELRNAAAWQAVNTSLGTARSEGVQVWPLGFGTQVTQDALDKFATGGSQQGCDDRPESRPKARIVQSSADVQRSMLEAYASASCSGLSQTQTGSLPPGSSRTLSITIPDIATDGRIIVAKGDPRVYVEYVDPQGHTMPVTGTADGTTVSLAGQNTAYETLGLLDPVPGTWQVKLSAPSGLGQQVVSTTAIWQGAVQASIHVNPPQARTGQPMTVWLSLLTRNGTITDPKALSQLSFHVTATGPTLPGPQIIQMRDDGQPPDTKAGDGQYAGTFTAPGRPGDITFTGVVAGEGIYAQRIPIVAKVSTEAPAIQGDVSFTNLGVVHPGDSVNGIIEINNAGPSPVNGRLLLDGPARAKASLPATDFSFPVGKSTRKFKVGFGRDAATGGASFTLKVVAVDDLSKVYTEAPLTVTIKQPPGIWERYRWYFGFLALLLLIGLGALYAFWQSRRSAVDVRGLVVMLNDQDGERIGLPMKARTGRGWQDRFPFRIIEEPGEPPRLGYPSAGEQAHVARRGPAGQVIVTTPRGDRLPPITLGTVGDHIPTADGTDSEWTLAFRDDRKRPAARHPSRPEPSPASHGEPGPSQPSPTPTGHDDDWL